MHSGAYVRISKKSVALGPSNITDDEYCYTNLLEFSETLKYANTILSRVWGSMTNKNGFWIGWLDLLTPSLYNLSYSQSIIALSLICPLHKSLGDAIRFLATDVSQELSLQITMKISFNFFFIQLGLPILQNSTQFSDYNSLISWILTLYSVLGGIHRLLLYRR
jgi:hypothetical protein